MNELQEKTSPSESRKRSSWQRYRDSPKARRTTTTLLFVLPIAVLIILMFTIFIRAPFNPKEGLTTAPTRPRPANTLNSMVTQVLNDMNAHSWDEQHQTTLINWRKSDTRQVNCSPKVCDQRGHSTRKDSANDLRLLENMYWYRSTHPGDTSMNRYIMRLLPTVQREWGHTVLNKGWVYFTLMHLRDFSHDTDYWNNTMRGWAASQYKLIDPQLGIQHGPVATTAGSDSQGLQDGYRVDHALETGLALVDAGTRFQHPEWIIAGRRDVQVVIQQTYNTHYHLFGRLYLINDPKFGSHKLLDPQARMGETGQEIEALIRSGVYTHTPAYLSLAKEMLDGLETSPLRDPVNGGFYFKLFLGSYLGHEIGYVDKSIKETRQLHVLVAVHLANQVFNNRWLDLEQSLINVARQRLFLAGPIPGFSYRVLPNGEEYPCKTCVVPRREDWVTSEADNIALIALQTVISNEKVR